MSFRARLALVAAAAVALAVVAASAVIYFVVRGELYDPVERGLRHRADEMAHHRDGPGARGGPGPDDEGGLSRYFFIPEPRLGGAGGYPQIVTAAGHVILPPYATVQLPKTDGVLDVARGERGDFFTDTHVAGTHVRVLTFHFAPGLAVEIARPLTEVDDALGKIRWLLVAIAAAGVAVAAGLGLVVARAALAPVRRLTATTERVAATAICPSGSRTAARTSSAASPRASTRCWPHSRSRRVRSGS